ETEEAFAPQSIVLHLEDDIDISRGDMIVPATDIPRLEQELLVDLCWMGNKPLLEGSKYLLQINSRRVKAVVKEIEYRLDVNSLEKKPASGASLNDVVRAKIRTASPVAYDPYRESRANGGAILIDETSHVTVGACMINE
ncbi:MAG TPA: sulfate adenylyltransferase, partial [Sediminibacterium sp.]